MSGRGKGTGVRRGTSDAELEAALERIRVVASHRSVAVCGGYAMRAYGSDRMTFDLDLIADAPIPGYRQGRRLTFGGYSTRVPVGGGSSVPLDVILRKDDLEELYDEALARAHRIAGVALPVVTAEHLAAMKLASGRPKDDLDLLFLLSGDVLSPRVLHAVVERHLGRYAVREIMSRRLEAVWRRKTGQL